MGFPSTVKADLVSGVVGEVSHDGPFRSRPGLLGSLDAANNVIGRAFTYAYTDPQILQAGGIGPFGGILILPKTHVLYGMPGDTLADSMTLPNGAQGEFAEMGFLTVALASPGATIGKAVVYDLATGELDWANNSAEPGAGKMLVPNCFVDRCNASDDTPSLAFIKVTN